MKFTKLNQATPEYIYNYMIKTRSIGKFVHLLFIKPTTVKYYFVKADDITITPSNNMLTILEGFTCEQSDLSVKPSFMSDEEYISIPNEYKGVMYNIYYETDPFLFKVKYHNENDTQNFYTVFDSQRVVHYYMCFNSLDEIREITNSDFTTVFIA